MLRLTILLCGGLFVFLLVAGEDRGQVRHGLLAPPVQAIAVAPTVPAPVKVPVATVSEAVFIPALPDQPVRQANAQTAAQPTVGQVAETQVTDIAAQGRLAVVTARAVNVRSGPTTEAPVVGRLTTGEEVLVVADQPTVDGWSRVRIEGDGVTGYVATRLLQPIDP